MEWFKIVSQFVSSIIWPSVVLLIVLIFRRELRNIIGAIKEVKYPGGSVTMEVAVLEERIERNGVREKHSPRLGLSAELLASAADPQLERFHDRRRYPW
jgi:hypothetical protein